MINEGLSVGDVVEVPHYCAYGVVESIYDEDIFIKIYKTNSGSILRINDTLLVPLRYCTAVSKYYSDQYTRKLVIDRINNKLLNFYTYDLLVEIDQFVKEKLKQD